jgi:hypothetical protein
MKPEMPCPVTPIPAPTPQTSRGMARAPGPPDPAAVRCPATPNPDGTYTLVLSPTDPGVANWIDTGGLNQGILPIRFQNMDPNATALPTLSGQTVTLDQLTNVLPPSTKYVTPEERAAQLAARNYGYERRYAPFPQG